ncbi:membrane protein [Streptomyces sp. CNQ-509]|nr:membrane protein [Streptomyces sp. CNQ-509]
MAGAALLAEAVALAVVHFVLGSVVDRQDMSLAGLDSGLMSASTRAAGVAIGLYLLCCGAVALRIAVRDRAPGRAGRILLVSCAVLHAVLAAVAVGLVGWAAFAGLMVLFGLIVLTLTAEDVPVRQAEGGAEPAPAA